MAKHEKLVDTEQLDESQLMQIERPEAPATGDLEKRIIAAAKDLPQQLTRDTHPVKVQRWVFWPSAAASLVAISLVALSVVLLSWQEPATVDQLAELSEQGYLDELAWQDAILVYDEVAFAEY